MNRFLCSIVLASLVSIVQAKNLDEYIKEAQNYHDAGNLEQAITIMELAVNEHPKSSLAYAKLGDFISGKAQRYIEMFAILPRAFAMWDKAISLDSDNLEARFSRGTWGVYVPQTMGQLDKAVFDLEYVVEVLQKSTDPDIQTQLVEAYSSLADGYRKQYEFDKAKMMYTKIIETTPETNEAGRAQTYIEKIIHFEKWLGEEAKSKEPDSPEIIVLKEKAQKNPDDVDLLLMLGNTYLEANKDEEAAEIFERAVSLDTMNLKAYKMLAFTIKRIFQAGYDPRISMDHNYRTDLAFRMMSVMDKAVTIAPEDLEMRLMRGTAGLESFFFIGRIDQAVEDLQMVVESDAPDAMKAAARYEIGRAHQQKMHSHWLKVISEYPDEQTVDSVFNKLNPGLKQIDISHYETPVVVIDFILGFKDELPPQTAIWVEDENGAFVKTIYVSGFSGYARSMGRIPQWTRSSQFIDADAVTGASIDIGHHIYVWDLKGLTGSRIKSGEYVIKVETAFWPSMQYQCVEAPITLGKKEERVVIEEGNFIPYLEVKYLP